MELTVRSPPAPHALRPGDIALVEAAAHRVHRHDGASAPAPFKLVVQLEGVAGLRQGQRQGCLQPGEFGLIDAAHPFALHMDQPFRQCVLALPRSAVLARHRGIVHRTGHALGSQAGEALLADFLQTLGRRANLLDDAARWHVVAAVVELLGAVAAPERWNPREDLRRRAWALVDLEIAEVDADSLARRLGVSRRHLDAVFAETGRPFGKQLWDRRLALAAERLGQSMPASHTELAHAVGFKDASHFARLFRRRYGMTPTAWREQARAGRASGADHSSGAEA